MTHICVSKLIIIGSDNGLSPGRHQATIWTNIGILLIGPLGTNFSEISIEIHISSFKKMHLKRSSAILSRPQCATTAAMTQRFDHYDAIHEISSVFEMSLWHVRRRQNTGKYFLYFVFLTSRDNEIFRDRVNQTYMYLEGSRINHYNDVKMGAMASQMTASRLFTQLFV